MKFSACGVEDMANSEKLAITVNFGDPIRSHRYDADFMLTWDLFLTYITKSVKGIPSQITYVDDEGDKITLGSESEWIEALKVAKKCNSNLRLNVEGITYTSVTERKVKVESAHENKQCIDYNIKLNEDDAKSDKKFEENSCIASDPPPSWFFAYMQTFKKEIVNEMKSELENQFKHMSLAYSNNCQIDADSEAKTGLSRPADLDQVKSRLELLDLPSEKSSRMGTTNTDEQCQLSEELSANESDKNLRTELERICCRQCKMEIVGTYYKCGYCEDYQLCGNCEGGYDFPHGHDPQHVFVVVHKSGSKDSVKDSFRSWEGVEKQREICMLNSKQNDRLGQYLKDPETGFSLFRSLKPVRLIMDAEFLFDETVPDGSKFPPGSIFTKRWRVINCGSRAWNSETTLRFLWGTKNFTPSVMEIAVPHLSPGQDGSVEVQCSAPMRPGYYESHWNFVHKGHLFGHRIWCSIEVTKPLSFPNEFHGETELHQMKCDEKLSAEGFVDNVNADVELSSNVEPIDQSFPDPLTFIKDYSNSTADKGINTESEISSIVSLSSCDSEQDYVVVPMPPCFIIPGINCSPEETEQTLKIKEKYSRASSSSSVIFLTTPDSEDEARANVDSNSANDCASVLSDRITNEHSYFKTPPVNEKESVKNTTNDDSKIIDNSADDNDNICIQKSDEHVSLETVVTPTISKTEHHDAGDNTSLTGMTASSAELANENVVQILPEGLVSAATMLLNTARAAISNVTRNSPPRELLVKEAHEIQDSPYSSQLSATLWEMGFYNKHMNESVIEKHNGDQAKVVDELLRLYDNDWHSYRH